MTPEIRAVVRDEAKDVLSQIATAGKAVIADCKQVRDECVDECKKVGQATVASCQEIGESLFQQKFKERMRATSGTSGIARTSGTAGIVNVRQQVL
jgi:hypothetical protein